MLTLNAEDLVPPAYSAYQLLAAMQTMQRLLSNLDVLGNWGESGCCDQPV